MNHQQWINHWLVSLNINVQSLFSIVFVKVPQYNIFSNFNVGDLESKDMEKSIPSKVVDGQSLVHPKTGHRQQTLGRNNIFCL